MLISKLKNVMYGLNFLQVFFIRNEVIDVCKLGKINILFKVTNSYYYKVVSENDLQIPYETHYFIQIFTNYQNGYSILIQCTQFFSHAQRKR